MIKLADLLKEARQVGTLYHFTNLRGLESIIESNTIRATPGYVNGDPSDRVSFTRNKNYYWDIIRIGVDGSKLSNKYKITPYSYYYGQGKGSSGTADQSEEIVEKDISNAKSYIIDVTYILDKHKAYGNKVPISYLLELWPSMKFSYKGKEYTAEQATKEFKFPAKKSNKGGEETGLYDTKISYDEMGSLKGKLMYVYYHLTHANKLTDKNFTKDFNDLLKSYKLKDYSDKTGVERSNSEALLKDMMTLGKKYGINTTKDFYGDIMVGDLEMYRDEEEENY